MGTDGRFLVDIFFHVQYQLKSFLSIQFFCELISSSVVWFFLTNSFRLPLSFLPLPIWTTVFVFWYLTLFACVVLHVLSLSSRHSLSITILLVILSSCFPLFFWSFSGFPFSLTAYCFLFRSCSSDFPLPVFLFLFSSSGLAPLMVERPVWRYFGQVSLFNPGNPPPPPLRGHHIE